MSGGGPASFSARQRGAVVMIAAAAMVAVLALSALAVDYGRLAWTHRYHQQLSDIAALDASRLICDGGLSDAGPLLKAAMDSAEANGFAVDADHRIAVQPGIVVNDAEGLRALKPTAVEDADAVQVTVTESNIPRSLLFGGLMDDNTPLTFNASAVAANPGLAGIGVGSYLLRVDTADSPFLNAILGTLLGTRLSLDGVSYQGLAAAGVTLLDLIHAHATVGSVQELLDAELTLGDFYLLLAKALSLSGESGTVFVEILEGLAVKIDSDLQLRIGDLLEVNLPSPDAALDARVGILDMMMLGAQVANGEHAVVADAKLDLKELGKVALTLEIIEPPQTAVGRPGRNSIGEWKTKVHTAQVHLDLTVDLLKGLNTNLDGEERTSLVSVNVGVEVARADAWLEHLGCPRAGEEHKYGKVGVGVQPGIAFLCVAYPGTDCSDPEEVKKHPAMVLNVLNLLTIEASAWTAIQPPAPTSFEFKGPFDPEADPPSPAPEHVGSPLLESLANGLAILAGNLKIEFGGALGPLLDALHLNEILEDVLELLVPVVKALAPLVDGLLRALGISLGGADVWVYTLAGGDPLSPTGRPEPQLVR